MEILLNDLVCFSLFSIKSSNKIKTILSPVHVLNKKNKTKQNKTKKKLDQMQVKQFPRILLKTATTGHKQE